MNAKRSSWWSLAILLTFSTLVSGAFGQNGKGSQTPVLWRPVDVPSQDTYLGPGGRNAKPDLSKVTFLRQEKGGYSTKYRIKDGSGKTWVAKVGREAQSETAAVRLLSALGYETEINYLVPQITIPGKGTFLNARLEARPDTTERGKDWKWESNPFRGTREFQGLKIMMAFINNWDMKNANNVVLEDPGRNRFVVSDLGVSFGKTGSNGLPLFWMIGRSRNKPLDYSKSKFVTGTSKGRVKLHFNGKNRAQMKDISIADARWLADLLTQLTDKQITDIFRAANYRDTDIALLTRAVKRRIAELERIGDTQLATSK